MPDPKGVFSFIKTHTSEVCLALLCVVLFVSHTLYVARTYQNPQSGLDEPVYMDNAIATYDILRQDPVTAWPKLLKINANRQPLYPLFLALPLLITGTDHAYKTALWINILFYMTAVVSVYYIAKKFLSKVAGFLAAYMFAFYGFPLFYLHFVYGETAVTAFITLSVAYLVRSEGLTKRSFVIPFSFLFTIASLTRWVAPLFIAGPLAATVWQGFSESTGKSFRKKMNLFVGIAMFIVIGAVPGLLAYYLPQLGGFWQYVSANTDNANKWAFEYLGMSSSEGVFSVRSVMFYLNILSQQGIFFWMVFVVGFLVSLRYFKKYLVLIAGFVVPYLIFTFGSTWKGDRFILPIYPFMALISAVVFDHVRVRWVRRTFIILALTVGFLNFVGASWGMGPLGQQGLKDIVLPELIHHPRRIYLTTMVWPPRPNEGNVQAIVDMLISDWDVSYRPFVYASAFYMPQIEDGLGEIFFREKRGIGSEAFFLNMDPGRFDSFLNNLMHADYLLIKDGVVDGKYTPGVNPVSDDFIYYIIRLRDALQKNGGNLPPGYRLVGTIPVPFDHSMVRIYRKGDSVKESDWVRLLGE